MLETTIDATPTDGAVEFQLRVTNSGEEDVQLSFSDSQRVRVSVYRGTKEDSDEPQWRSDEDQMFMQVLGTETVPSGGETVFVEAWNDPESGDYFTVGELTCQGQELRAETTFSV